MFKREDENYVYLYVSQNIKRIRKEKGIKAKELAKRVGYTYQYIKNLESPSYHQTFSIITLMRFAKALDVDVSLLLEEKNN